MPFTKGQKVNMGRKQSREHIEKRSLAMSVAMLGKHNSPETEFTKGQTPWNKGKKMPFVARGKTGLPAWNRGLRGYMSGSKHYNWKGGITAENTRIRNSLDSKVWKQAVKQRDDWTCVICGIKNHVGLGKSVKLHADHIKPFSLFPELRFAIDNGRTLCEDCHRKTDTFAGRIRRYKK